MAYKTPVEEEWRIANRIRENYGRQVRDRVSFDVAFSEQFELASSELSAKQKRLRDRTFNSYVGLKGVKREFRENADEKVFAEAGGKDLKRDREKTAKTVVSDVKEYRKKGANRVDLKGFDTKRRLEIPARKKGRIVYAERTFVMIKGRQFMRFRDRRGQFVSIKG